MLSSRRMPAEYNAPYAQDSYAARKRSRSFAGPVAVPLGSAYSEPHQRPNARRSASNHRDSERERERMHRRYDSSEFNTNLSIF